MEDLNKLIGRRIRVTDYQTETVITYDIISVTKTKQDTAKDISEKYLVGMYSHTVIYEGDTTKSLNVKLWRTDLELLLKNEVVKFEGIEYELIREKKKSKPEVSDIFPDLSKVKDEDFFDDEQPLNLFLVNWKKERYGDNANARIVPIEFFTEENGFEKDEIDIISKIKIGEIQDSEDLSIGRIGNWDECAFEWNPDISFPRLEIPQSDGFLINYNELETYGDGIDALTEILVDATFFVEENGWAPEEIKEILLLRPGQQFSHSKVTGADRPSTLVLNIQGLDSYQQSDATGHPNRDMWMPLPTDTIGGIELLIDREILRIKMNNEYEGTELATLREGKILDYLRYNFKYDWESDDKASEYFAKATQLEIWNYYKEYIIPMLGGKQVEMEHKDTIEKIAEEHLTPEQGAELIAEDHLKESPEYYKRLKELEEKGFKSEEEYDTAMREGQLHYNISGAFNSNDYELIRDGLETLKNSLETNIESPQFNVGMKRLMKEQVKSIEKLISKIQNY